MNGTTETRRMTLGELISRVYDEASLSGQKPEEINLAVAQRIEEILGGTHQAQVL